MNGVMSITTTGLADAMKTLGIPNTSEPLSAAMGQSTQGTGTVFDVRNMAEVSSRILVNDYDLEVYRSLPENITREYYYQIITLIEKIEQAENGSEYTAMLQDLQQKKETLDAVNAEIESINAEIRDKLYPFEHIGIQDKATIQNLSGIVSAS